MLSFQNKTDIIRILDYQQCHRKMLVAVSYLYRDTAIGSLFLNHLDEDTTLLFACLVQIHKIIYIQYIGQLV